MLSMPHRRIVYRSLAFWSIEWFALHVTSRWTKSKLNKVRFPIPEFHRELWRVTLEGEDMVIICPRNFAKSTVVSKILSLWLLVFELEPSILLISNKGLGEDIIGDIRRELEENKLIRYLWGQLVPVENKHDNKIEKWRQSQLQLLNGCEIKTLSKGQSIRGQRPTLILVDDPEENKDVKNPVKANEFSNWVFTSLYNALDEGGRMIVLGTIIGGNCFINRLKAESQERNFRVIEYPALLNFDETKIRLGELNGKPYYFFDSGIGQPLWPFRWSIEKLERMYNKIRHDAFMQEYMHVPLILNGSPVFDKKYTFKVLSPISEIERFEIFKSLTYQDEQGKEKKYNAYIGLDLADGGVDGDYNVIVIRNDKMELLAQLRIKIAQDILVEMLDKLIPYFDDVFIVPENNHGLVFINCAKQKDWFFKIYRKRTFDKITAKESEEIGFNTNVKTKPYIINELDQVLRLGNFEVSQVSKDEIQHYYYDEKGSANAIYPWHDDTVIAEAMCIQAVKHGVLAPLFS